MYLLPYCIPLLKFVSAHTLLHPSPQVVTHTRALLDLGCQDMVRVGSVRKIAKPVLPFSTHGAHSEKQVMPCSSSIRLPYGPQFWPLA